MAIWFAAPIDQYPDYDKVTTTPTATNANSSFPAANLLTYDPTQVFVATNQSTVITWNMGAQKSFDMIALIFTNLTELATWTVEHSNDGTTYTPIVSGVSALAHMVAGQTVQNAKNKLRRNDCMVSFTAVTRQYIRVTVNSGSAGILPSIGRLFVGSRLVPTTRWQYGSVLDFEDPSTSDRTEMGALILSPRNSIPTAAVKMDFLTQTEMQDFIWEFNYWRGAGREIYACLDDVNTKWLQKNLFYCTIKEGRRISFEAFNAHSVTWQIESIGA